MTISRPAAGEYSPFHTGYLRLIPDGADPLRMLEQQSREVAAILDSLTDQQALFRYEPGKWSLKESLVHMIDTERIFAYRALRIGRGDQTPLPGFEQDDYAPTSGADGRSIPDIRAEYMAVRTATLLLFGSFSESAWVRVGRVNDHPLSVRALVYILAGHEAHHLKLFREHYLNDGIP